jgi:hypothetical protein
MKHTLTYLICAVFTLSTLSLSAQTQVTYKLSYDVPTQTYTVSMKSNTAYNAPLSRMTNSTQITIVTPHVAGGWQPASLTNLTTLNWGVTVLDGTTTAPPIPANDYLFFAPSNAGTYTPFAIPANTYIDLFSFKSGVGCVGALSLYHNTNDPLNSIVTINGDNNMVILGAGAGNKYVGNDSGSIPCNAPCAAAAGTLSY